MENSQGHYPNDSRYKSMQSEEDTRNPTTSKKVHGTPIQFRRSQPYPYPNARPSRLATHSLSIEEELYSHCHLDSCSRPRSCSICDWENSRRPRRCTRR
jgi:hypothetical protein